MSDPVADLVVRRWGVPRPTVLLNCPPAWRPDEPGPIASDRIRAATGIEPERPIVLYQGGFSVDRGVEELVAAATVARLMELGAAVVFMGYGRLETDIAEAAARPSRAASTSCRPSGPTTSCPGPRARTSASSASRRGR